VEQRDAEQKGKDRPQEAAAIVRQQPVDEHYGNPADVDQKACRRQDNLRAHKRRKGRSVEDACYPAPSLSYIAPATLQMQRDIDAALGFPLLDIEIAFEIVVLGVVRKFSKVAELTGDSAARRPTGNAALEPDLGAVEIDIDQGSRIAAARRTGLR
jgi:hypothetical protein